MERLDRSRAGGDEQHVVAEPLTAHGLDFMRMSVDASQPAADVCEAGVRRHALERIRGRATRGEGGEDAQRAVGQVGFGGEQRGAHPVAGETVQRQRGFQSGRTAAGDEDVRGHTGKLGPGRAPDVRGNDGS